MAATSSEPTKARNFYADAAKDPEVLERRRQKKEELDAQVQQMITRNPGRVPRFDRQTLMQIDRFCLENNKRCIMWDDANAGFYLMLNWDWLRNQPAHPPSSVAANEPGWWARIKLMLKAPLLDPNQSDEELSAWVDAHTMKVHVAFLDKLHKLRLDPATQKLVLDDPYWQELQAISPQQAEGEAAQLPQGLRPVAGTMGAAGAISGAPQTPQPLV